MAGIMTPAMASIERGDILPFEALRFADEQLAIEGIDPQLAFSDYEVHRHHRALAIGYLASTETSPNYHLKQGIQEAEL